MRTTRIEMNFYSIYDRAGLEKHLEDMAAKGWMLDKMGQYLWYYRRTESRKIKFAVSFFPSASVFDPAPSEKQETYREFCEHAGWNFIGCSGQLEVYWHEDENAVPLLTDPMMEIKTIHKTAKKTVILSNVLLFAIVIMNVCRTIQFYRNNTISALLSDSNFWTALEIVFVGVYCVSELIRYFAWYFKAKKIAESEEHFLTTKSTIGYTKAMLGIMILLFVIGFASFMLDESILVGAVILGYSTVIFAIVFGIKSILKKMNASTNVNRTITFISCFVVSLIVTSIATFFILRNIEPHQSYQEELPLSIEDLAMVEIGEYSCYENMEESSVLKRLSVRQESSSLEEVPELSYAVIDIKYPALYDVCVEAFLKGAGKYNSEIVYHEITDEIWGADKVYRLHEGAEYLNTYLLCYENRIVQISLYDFDTVQNPAFAKIISEKLKPN